MPMLVPDRTKVHAISAVISLAGLMGVPAAALAQGDLLQSFSHDLVAPGSANVVGVYAPVDPNTSTNRTVRVVNADSSFRYDLPPASGVGAPHGLFDRFGFLVGAFDGLADSSSRELVTCSPLQPGVAASSFMIPRGLGSVNVFNGDSGAGRLNILANAGTRLGLELATVPDQDEDQKRELLVAGAVLAPGNKWLPRTFVFSGGSGRLLATRPESVSRLVTYVDEAGRLYLSGDLDNSGTINAVDLSAMVPLLNTAGQDNPHADLNRDGVVDALDLSLQITAYLAGWHSIAMTTVPETDSHAWDQAAARWSEAFTGTLSVPNAAPPTPPEENGGGSPFLGFGVVPCSCAGGPPPDPMRTCTIGITGCPGIVRLNQPFTLEPIGGTNCVWSIVGPPGVIGSVNNNGTFVGLAPGLAAVRLECTDGEGCCSCAECIIHVGAPQTQECNPKVEILCCGERERYVSAGMGYRITAKATPPGGHFFWSLLTDTPDAIDWTRTRLGDWPTIFVAFSETPPGGSEPKVYIRVTYRFLGNSCPEVTAECLFYVRQDFDKDGLIDAREWELGTDPGLADTDGDGWDDGWEVNLDSNPLDRWIVPKQVYFDTDHDGLSDAEELCRYATDPRRFDTDGDGVSDLAEVSLALVLNSPPTPAVADAQWLLHGLIDPDGPCYSMALGVPFTWTIFDQPATAAGDRLDPRFLAADKDGDLLIDTFERQRGLDPLKQDSDGDGIPDGIEFLAGRDALAFDTVPLPDADADGLADMVEMYIYQSNPLNPDSDADGLPDGWEVRYGLSPTLVDSDGDGIVDGDEDLDGDGLRNLLELEHGGNPRSNDTDGDGTSDLQEVLVGGDPSNAGDLGLPVRAPSWIRLGVRVIAWGKGRPCLRPVATARVGPISATTTPGFADGWNIGFSAGAAPAGKLLPVASSTAWIPSDDCVHPADHAGLYQRLEYGIATALGGSYVWWGTNDFDAGHFTSYPLTSVATVYGVAPNIEIAPEPFERYMNEGWPVSYLQPAGGTVIVGQMQTTIEDEPTSESGKAIRISLSPNFLEQEDVVTRVWGSGPLPPYGFDSEPANGLRHNLPVGWQQLELWVGVSVFANATPPFYRLRGPSHLVMSGGRTIAVLGQGVGIAAPGTRLPFVSAKMRVHDAQPLAIWVDSTNTLGFSRSYGEGVSAAEQTPGKLIFVNDGDADGDDIPNWADGFKFQATDFGAAPQAAPDAVDQIRHPGLQRMVPLVVRYNPAAGENQTLTFTYAASNPADVAMRIPSAVGPNPSQEIEFYLPGGDPHSPGYGQHSGERYRIWAKIPEHVRDARPVSTTEAGDFVPTGVQIPVDRLDPDHIGEIVLFVEAVRPNTTNSQDTITVSVQGGDYGGTTPQPDVVNIAALQTRMVEVQRDPSGALHPVPVAGPRMSELAPVVTFSSSTPPAITNVRIDPITHRILGDVALRGTVDDPLMDLVRGEEGVISKVHVVVNEDGPLNTNGHPIFLSGPSDYPSDSPLQFTKQDTQDPLRPFDFSGEFNVVLEGVSLHAGENHIRVLAKNSRGTFGQAVFIGEVDVTPPPDEAFDVAIDLGGQNPRSGVTGGQTAPGTLTLTRTENAAPTTYGPIVLNFQGNGIWTGSHASGAVRIQFSPTTQGSDFATWALVTAPGAFLDEVTFDLKRPAPAGTLWAGHRDIDEFDRKPDQRWTVAPGPSQIVPSFANEDHPYVYEYLGPPGLPETNLGVSLFNETESEQRAEFRLRQMTIGDGAPGWYFVRPHISGNEPPAVFHILARDEPAPPSAAPIPAKGLLEYHFHEGGHWGNNPLLYPLGSTRGAFDCGWSMVEGCGDLIKLQWKVNPIRWAIRFARDGGTLGPLIAEETAQIRPAAEFAGKFAALLARIYVDDEVLAQAMETGDYSQVPEMTQRYGSILIEVLQVYKEVNDNLVNVIESFDTYDWGYMGGRLGGEVATTVVPLVVTLPAGGVGVAPKLATLVNALKKIKNLEVVRKIIPLLTRLTLIATRYDEIALAIRLYKAEACEDLWRVFERILGKNPGLGHSQAMRQALRELDTIGAKLTQEQRRDAAFALCRRLLHKGDGNGRKYLTYDEWNALLSNHPTEPTLGAIRKAMHFQANHGAPDAYLKKYVFPNDPQGRNTTTWINANTPTNPLPTFRHGRGRGEHGEPTFHDILDRMRDEFVNAHEGQDPSPLDARGLIYRAWTEMHVRYSRIDTFDYLSYRDVVDNWLILEHVP